jgi:hypothetical protein
MPFIEGDRITVTDPASAYYGHFGTVSTYWSNLECPIVDVKLDEFFVPATFNETSIAVGEHVVRPLPEYEYNLRVDGKIFYTVWSTQKEMVDLWLNGSFNGHTLQELKEYLAEYRPDWKLVRRVRSEIEDV